MGAVDEERAELSVAGFGDTELFIRQTGLIASRDESEISADVASVREVIRIFNREDETESGKWSDARDLAEALSDRVLLGGDHFELFVERADALVELINRVEEFGYESSVFGAKLGADLFGEGHGFDG